MSIARRPVAICAAPRFGFAVPAKARSFPGRIHMPRMSTLDLKAMLASEKADALAAISAARLAEERADAMDYYLGHMDKDMPAQDGRSRAVSPMSPTPSKA